MIEQYLSNTNEIATVLILPKILELNKAYIAETATFSSYYRFTSWAHLLCTIDDDGYVLQKL